LKHRNKNKRFIVWIVLPAVIIVYMFIYINNNIKATLVAVSEIRAKAIATQAINDATSIITNDNIDYTDLISVKYDDKGKVTLMQANTILMNSIASEVAVEVQNQLKNISKSDIKIPLNNAFDIQIVKLPSIKLQIVPQGAVTVDFATEFQESGINQTRHRIYLIVIAEIKIIVPLVSENIKVTSSVPIAETIIIGDVPNQYVNVPKDDILSIIK
jgi:sporulation protein YunB